MRHKPSEFLEKEEIQSLYRTCDKNTLRGLRDFCILSLMLHTGLRRHEVSALPREALQSQAGRVYVYARTKGDQSRKIAIWDPELLKSLDRYFEKTGGRGTPGTPMFWSMPKGPEKRTRSICDQTIRRIIKRAVRRARISKRITPHSLRHTFLTQALRAGADIKTVQVMAGHSNISTTSRYLHTDQEQMDKAIKNLEF